MVILAVGIFYVHPRFHNADNNTGESRINIGNVSAWNYLWQAFPGWEAQWSFSNDCWSGKVLAGFCVMQYGAVLYGEVVIWCQHLPANVIEHLGSSAPHYINDSPSVAHSARRIKNNLWRHCDICLDHFDARQICMLRLLLVSCLAIWVSLSDEIFEIVYLIVCLGRPGGSGVIG